MGGGGHRPLAKTPAPWVKEETAGVMAEQKRCQRLVDHAERKDERDERSSRTTMTKSISRSQVRLIASTNAIFGADEA